MGLLAVCKQVEVGTIERIAEHHTPVLTDAGKLPVVKAGKGGGNDDRPGVVDDLADAAVPFPEHTILVAGSLREEHHLLIQQKVVDRLSGPHIPAPLDRKGSP